MHRRPTSAKNQSLALMRVGSEALSPRPGRRHRDPGPQSEEQDVGPAWAATDPHAGASTGSAVSHGAHFRREHPPAPPHTRSVGSGPHVTRWNTEMSQENLPYYRVLRRHKSGAPGGLSRLSVRLLISAQVVIPGSWDRAPCPALCGVWSLLRILSLLPLPLPRSVFLSL